MQEFPPLANAHLGVFDLPHSSQTHLIDHTLGALPVFQITDESSQGWECANFWIMVFAHLRMQPSIINVSC
jgi:hypothetical protein